MYVRRLAKKKKKRKKETSFNSLRDIHDFFFFVTRCRSNKGTSSQLENEISSKTAYKSFGVHIEIHEIRALGFCDSFSLVNTTFLFVYPEKFITIRILRQAQFFFLFAENGSATCLRLVETLTSRDLLL